MKVLVIGPAWVGDMIMSQVLYKVLAEQYRSLSLTVVAPQVTVSLLERMPEVSEQVVLSVGHRQLQLRHRYQLARRLRSRGFDQAIVLPNSFKSALIPYWADIKRRTGWRGEHRYGLLNDLRRLDPSAYPLMIERFAALAFQEGAPLPPVLPHPLLTSDEQSQQALCERLELSLQSQIMVLCPGAAFGTAKRWPVAYFAQVAAWFIHQGGQVWVLGSPAEVGLANELSSALSAVERARLFNFAGKTCLLEALDLMSMADVVVSNDSGLMHMATALDKPVIALFGSTSPGFTPPLGSQDRTRIVSRAEPCQPCFKRECPLGHMDCLNKLLPGEVIGHLRSILPSQVTGLS